MANYQEGDFTVASQHGAKSVSLPLQNVGNSYATEIRRGYRQLAAYWDPIRNDSYSYTNLLLRSDDFSNASWTKAAATGTASAATDLEGGTTATKLAEDATNAAHNASQALTVASGALSFGGFFKADARNYVRLRINNGTDGNLAAAVFDLSTGTVLSGTGSIKKLFNGWYWCTVTGTATVSNSTCFVDLTSDGSTFTYSGTDGAGVLAWRLTAIASAPAVPWPAIATTAATRTVTVPPVDPDDATAFLVEETEPEAGTLEVGVSQWSRRYANVPATTEYFGSIAINKPAASSVGGTARSEFTYSFVATNAGTGYVFDTSYFSRLGDVYSPLRAISFAQTVPTSGTYTLTYKTSTTGALAYDASGATINAAINALADVIADGLTATAGGTIDGGLLQINWTGGFVSTPITCNAAGLSPAASQLAFTLVNGGTQHAISIAYRGTYAAHGYAGTEDLIAVFSGTAGILPAGQLWSVIDANTLAIHETFSAASSYGTKLRTYTPGPDRVRTKVSEAYYLPGYTVGISTAADIPIPSPLINDTELLRAAIATTTGFLTYDAEPLTFWDNRAPIYRQRTIKIDMADL